MEDEDRDLHAQDAEMNNIATFDEVGASPEQEDDEEEPLPKKKKGGKRAGKKSAPARSKIVDEQ